MKYLLDTDHISILQDSQAAYHKQLTPRVLANADDVVVSMASLHEQAMGCNTYIARARRPEGVAHGYDLLRRVLKTFSNFNVMPFDLQAANEFEALRAARVRISTMDLRIASIALTRSLIVVTRNLLDFRRVPGLQCEDWTC